MPYPEPPIVDVYRLLIVDDHPVVRQGLTQMIEGEADLKVVATASNATEALVHLRSASFDLAIVDISLRGLSGIDLLKDFKNYHPKMPVLMFSIHDEMSYAERALQAGARGYVMKHEPPERIIVAIRRVLDGCLVLSDATNSHLLSKALGNGRELSPPSNMVDPLSNRELEVFRLIGRALGTRDIAKQMHLSVKTVETYRGHIKKKLQLTTTPELMRAALSWLAQAES